MLISIMLLFGPAMFGTKKQELTYSAFVNEVNANRVQEVTIASDGKVDGTLKGGKDFTSRIPTGVGDPQVLPVLRAHGATVRAVPAGS
ncbi:MAG: ATP-dependent metallopeptidase FtsH/Yme1/Tma family protein, partial [Nocardioidaceae bacterium]